MGTGPIEKEEIILGFADNRGLQITSIIWLVAIVAALTAGLLNGLDAERLWPLAAIGIIPAILGLFLAPFSNREWAQVLVIMAWIALAIIACFAIAFVPMAILFLCAPAAASLFERERVVEAMAFSAIFAGIVFYAYQFGFAPEPIATPEQGGWGKLAAIVSTCAFMLGAMFAASQRSDEKSAKSVASKSLGFANHYPGAALKISKDGILQYATSSAANLFDLNKKDNGSLPIDELFATDDEARDKLLTLIDAARASGETMSAPITLASITAAGDGGGCQDLEFNIVPGKSGEVYVYTADCTEYVAKLRKFEHAMDTADKQASEKTLFFAGVSHELRTPLNAIIGFSDMMRSRLFGPLPGKYAEYADLIHDSGQHMLDLIGDVLDLSKIEAGKYELHIGEFNLADVVRSSIKMIRPAADAAALEIVTDIDEDPELLIEADRKAVRQILLNLLSNAVKFTPKGGRITVRAAHKENMINFSVEDTGTGIRPNELKTIGTPYKQGNNAQAVTARGTGLGLSLVKTLVDLHSGQFEVSSHPGVGTKIDITLPVNAQNSSRKTQDEDA